MARPKKNGLDYFPLDVDIFNDKKIKILYARFGADGYTYYNYLLCCIYHEGYYIEWDEDFDYICCKDLNMNSEKIGLMRKFLLERSLFNNILFKSDNILTSESIQKRYQEATKSRSDILVNSKFWLLKEDDTQSHIKVTHFQSFLEENGGFLKENSGLLEENAPKKSKVKKSKVKESSIYAPPSEKSADEAARANENFISLPLIDKSFYDVSVNDVVHYKELYPAVNVEQELRNMLGWLESNPSNRKTGNGIKNFITRWLKKCQDIGGNSFDKNPRNDKQIQNRTPTNNLRKPRNTY